MLSAVLMLATLPSKVTVEEPDEPDTKVVEPAVYVTVPALAVRVTRTISPFAHVAVLINDEPRPKLRADCAVAASVREKSNSVIVRVEIGSNSATYVVRLHAS